MASAPKLMTSGPHLLMCEGCLPSSLGHSSLDYAVSTAVCSGCGDHVNAPNIRLYDAQQLALELAAAHVPRKDKEAVA